MSREKGRRLGDMGEIIITSRSKNSSSCMGEVASSLAFVLGGRRERERADGDPNNRSQNLNGLR